MHHRASLCLLIAGVVLVAGSASAQTIDGLSADPSGTMRGQHSVSFGIGLLPDTQVGAAAVRSNGFLGSFSYSYWPRAEWGVEISASLLDSEVVPSSTASAMSFLVGVSYYPEALAISSNVRPYVTGAMGSYTAWEVNGSFNSSIRSESVPGARLGAGVDAYAWRWLRLGLRTAYHLAPDFDEPVGTIRNASGVQMSMEIGVALGGQ